MKLDLYVITDEGLAGGLPHSEIARRAVLGGADVIQFRDKTLTSREMVRVGREIGEITRKAGTLFIVNDRLDIALTCGADGVHLGQDDMGCGTARQLSPAGFIIGISVGSVDEALAAEQQGADYVAVSPVFPTGSKADAGPGYGLATLKDIRSAVSILVIGIGGIGPANAADVIGAGADGIAVISAVVSQPDITAAARRLSAIIAASKRARGGTP
ncbi:thiamine phosphate synthase [Methanoregula formicica]|uniref:Thiamine-phosphate synthase n=1 Tax=Methanoregula formicica (strain DSM 22288 / NBRC 105244 / SMSP) TaxID=593750 RepID=L0HFZ3_METFS|nr:thiamine phosphate synthase [Methanoregula formicica]AGB02014.1 thiamine-phosphate pyrophosphorylase [Methanoregula formicica SMSP]